MVRQSNQVWLQLRLVPAPAESLMDCAELNNAEELHSHSNFFYSLTAMCQTVSGAMEKLATYEMGFQRLEVDLKT